jgi:hypothetical protein
LEAVDLIDADARSGALRSHGCDPAAASGESLESEAASKAPLTAG